MPSLIEHVRKSVSAKAYYSAVFEVSQWKADNELRVKCLFHDDSSPSLYVNGDTGAWYCHGCQAGGKSIVSFHAELNEISPEQAAIQLFALHVRPVIDDKTIRSWARRLWRTPVALKYLRDKRLLSDEVIKKYQIGFDGQRFVIPVRNEFKLCVNAKLYDPLGKMHGQPKMLNYLKEGEPRKYGSPPMLFPVSLLQAEHSEIYVCEGEWDALALISLGLCAITSTAGCKSWCDSYNELFRGKSVNIVYDNDPDGEKYDKVPLRRLVNTARIIKRIKVPRLKNKKGKAAKDVTDWMLVDENMRAKKSWLRAAHKATVLVDNPEDHVERKETQQVPLNEASGSQFFHKRIAVEALVTGKDTAPFYLPSKYRVRCTKTCDNCPLAESMNDFAERTIDPSSPGALELIDCAKPTVNKALLKFAGFDAKPTCRAQVEVISVASMEHLLLIPTLDTSTGQYVMRPSYFVGHGLHTNRAYRFEGTTLPHPRDQHTTHLFDIARPVQGQVETFELTSSLKRQLHRFQPRRLNLMAHLMDIAEWQSRNVTKIKERPDLHIAVDLAFHSVPSFDFNGEHVRRGMLDVLILGDTRCGKGYVTEGLKRYYGLGEIASGENCTFAGLVGGVQQASNRWFITWGLIPLNHGRLVIIDETSSLSEAEIGHMSRVRSEGVAEIVKIVRESTQANTRLIWLSNTRSGRPITSYNTGVEAIRELVGATEDVSRFDFALTVANNEVPSELINAVEHNDTTDSERFPRDLCRSLVLWSWSRRPEQVKFTQSATEAIIRTSVDFGKMYSSSIPLVQAENIRIKLAKISAALAARVFSTDDEGEDLIVDVAHVNCARQFLQMTYAKASMSYDTFSRTAVALQVVEKPDEVYERLSSMGGDMDAVVTGLLELHKITPDTLADYVGDVPTSRVLIGELVKLRCVTRIEQGNWYLKNPAFSTWLRDFQRKSKTKVKAK